MFVILVPSVASFVYEPTPSFGMTMLCARLSNPTPPMMHVFVKSKVYQLREEGLPDLDEMSSMG